MQPAAVDRRDYSVVVPVTSNDESAQTGASAPWELYRASGRLRQPEGRESALAAALALLALAGQRCTIAGGVCTLGARIDSDDAGNLFAYDLRPR